MGKIEGRLKLIYRKQSFLLTLIRLPCNAHIQPHFDYACTILLGMQTEKM